MAKGMDHQKLAERTGYWPLFRYLPGEGLKLDSKPPTLPLKEYLYAENRYRLLLQTHPEAPRPFCAWPRRRCGSGGSGLRAWR